MQHSATKGRFTKPRCAETSCSCSTGKRPLIQSSKCFAALAKPYSGMRSSGKCFWIMSMNLGPSGRIGLSTGSGVGNLPQQLTLPAKYPLEPYLIQNPIRLAVGACLMKTRPAYGQSIWVKHLLDFKGVMQKGSRVCSIIHELLCPGWGDRIHEISFEVRSESS